MVYVERNNTGNIIGVYANPQPGTAEEEISDNDTEVLTFRARPLPFDIISDRQFFHALALSGMITREEALEAVKIGTLPVAFETFIATLGVDDQFNARMLLEGATTFKRSHPLSIAFGVMSGLTPAQVNDLWTLAGSL